MDDVVVGWSREGARGQRLRSARATWVLAGVAIVIILAGMGDAAVGLLEGRVPNLWQGALFILMGSAQLVQHLPLIRAARRLGQPEAAARGGGYAFRVGNGRIAFPAAHGRGEQVWPAPQVLAVLTEGPWGSVRLSRVVDPSQRDERRFVLASLAVPVDELRELLGSAGIRVIG